jgi:hypothetical protein
MTFKLGLIQIDEIILTFERLDIDGGWFSGASFSSS